MPQAYMNKLVKKGKSKKELEDKWTNAKKQAEKENKKSNYAYIMAIFKKMIGEETMEIRRNGKYLCSIKKSDNGKWEVTKESKELPESMLTLIEESSNMKSNPLELDDVLATIASARYIRYAREVYYNKSEAYYNEGIVFDMRSPKVTIIDSRTIEFSTENQSYIMRMNETMLVDVWSNGGKKGVTPDGRDLCEFHVELSKEEDNRIYVYHIDVVIAK